MPQRRRSITVIALLILAAFAILVPLLVLTGRRAETVEAAGPSFVDPAAVISNRANVQLADLVYVGPFAELRAGTTTREGIRIDSQSNLQDSTTLDATGGEVRLGKQVIVAPGGSVKGPATIGTAGVCPGGAAVCPSFVSFNAEVDGAIVEKDAMVSGLARVAPGVTIPSGRKVLPGKNVASTAEVAAKTVAVTEADRLLMQSVVRVNTAFAREYDRLARDNANNVRGAGPDPGNTHFNPNRNLPTLDGEQIRDPQFRNRIIGDVRMPDGLNRLGTVMGEKISLRADEGEFFQVGSITGMANNTTFHALEGGRLVLGNGGSYGARSIVHGGPTALSNVTFTGYNVAIGPSAVFSQSRIGDDSKVGAWSLVQASDLPAGTVVPDCTVIINNKTEGTVEWCRK